MSSTNEILAISALCISIFYFCLVILRCVQRRNENNNRNVNNTENYSHYNNNNNTIYVPGFEEALPV